MKYKVYAWRQHRFLTQQDVSERTGIARSNVSRIERGLQAPRPSTVRALARVLHVSRKTLQRLPTDED